MVIYNENDIDEIIFEMKNNKVAIIPTDTLYGIAAIDKSLIYKIKKRSYNKKIVLFVKDISYIKNASNDFKKLAKKFWPGKLTLIENGISYRIPDSKICLSLLNKLGQFYCSSANISGKEPIARIEDAQQVFSKNLESIVVVDTQCKHDGIASTIYDIDKHKVIREGKIKEGEINECLQINNACNR